jgi:hypothetical protein
VAGLDVPAYLTFLSIRNGQQTEHLSILNKSDLVIDRALILPFLFAIAVCNGLRLVFWEEPDET